MPNTLAHIGVQGLALRAGARRVETGWILLGVVIPDLPWILRRACLALGLVQDPIAIRLYTIVQASLFVCLVMCAGLALLASRPGRTFAVLAAGCVLHLVLDATQIKWGNGVHLLAPVSWEFTSWALYWPESAVTAVMTLTGVGWLAWEGVRRRPSVDLGAPRGWRLAGVAAFGSLYLLLPLAFTGSAYAADLNYVRTLGAGEEKVGRPVEFDRERLVERDGGPVLLAFGRSFPLRGSEAVPAVELRPGSVSVAGRFVSADTVRVERLRHHADGLRELASMIGLGLVTAWWGVALVAALTSPAAPASPPPAPPGR